MRTWVAVGWLLAGSSGWAADVVELELRDAGETQKVMVTLTETRMRVDLPRQKFSVIYEDGPQKFTGLEQRDYKYWEFLWPEISAAAAQSKRAAERLQDLMSQGLSHYEEKTPDSVVPIKPGPVWKLGQEKKTLVGEVCSRWTGNLDSQAVAAWSADAPLPRWRAALDRLRRANEPMALAAVRPLLPPVVFVIDDSLVKAGVTPVEFGWGSERDPGRLTLISVREAEVPDTFFQPPPTFLKTRLVALDGIIAP